MKHLLLVISFALCISNLFCQNVVEAEKLVSEGVELHDQGYYTAAIKKYDAALAADENNLLALSEKAFTFLAMDTASEAVECCKKAIEFHASDPELRMVYVTYGNSLDKLGKSDEALTIYDVGIALFPDYYLLHYNKGITFTEKKMYREAFLCFQKAVIANPFHANSHNAMARLNQLNSDNIPALFSYCMFLILEPDGERSAANLENLLLITSANVKKTDKNSVTINVDEDMLDDGPSDSINNFHPIELVLSLSAALDFDKEYKKDTDVKKFQRKFEAVCSSMSETMADNHGFYWEYYAPFFIEMNEQGYMETFSYMVFASSEDEYVKTWLDAHSDEINKFYSWIEAYVWVKK